MKLSEILRAGKQRIETLGWVQGDEAAFDGTMGCCAATALPVGWDEAGFRQTIAAADLIKSANGLNPMKPLSDWNDAPERTLPEVLAAYDKAIAAAEAQEQSK